MNERVKVFNHGNTGGYTVTYGGDNSTINLIDEIIDQLGVIEALAQGPAPDLDLIIFEANDIIRIVERWQKEQAN